MSIFKGFWLRVLKRIAKRCDHTVIPRIGAGIVLGEGQSMELYLPSNESFSENSSARSMAIMIAGAAIMLRDHEKNLTLYEALVQGAKEIGVGEDAGRVFAGSLINGKLDADAELAA